MSAMDELRAYVGDRFDGKKPTERTDRVRWVEVCVCGHLSTAHAPASGGQYRLAEPREITVGGTPVREVQAMDGCTGEMRRPTAEKFTDTTSVTDDGATVIVRHVNATCPCDSFRPVARVDRPHRYFNQRRPADRTDSEKHPFTVGMRSYRTRLGKLKRAQADDGQAWADAEFDRRFTWLPARVCGISRCTHTDDVWPVFVTDDRSELRCPRHRK
jgi:hypothetical protein